MNGNHSKKGDRIAVDPIRTIKDIKAISAITQDSPKDHLLFIMVINNGLRAGDIVKVEGKGYEGERHVDHQREQDPKG